MLTPGAFEDRRSLLTRLTVLRVGAVVGFTLLAVAFWTLQVAQHAKYLEWADNNYMRQIPLRAPRGVLFDRGGRVLVENRDSFTISIIRERTTDMEGTVTVLARVTGEDEQRIREVVQRHKREASFRPIPVIEHATRSQVAAVLARQLELPGVDVQIVPARAYPEGGMGAHLFGYVSEIQESQLERPEYAGLEAGAIVGQSGVERVYNASLQGTDGRRNVVINSVGREIHELAVENPVEGKRLQLTIDYDLQRALEEGFRASGYAGAAAFLDPRTGEVLAMTSLPSYDPNDFAVGIEGAKWAELNKDPLRPLENRLMRGRYAPGSTFKIVMSIAALSEGLITPDFKVFCPGSKTFYGRTWQCNRRGGHGVVDLRHAIEQSCNVYFYTVGDLLKIDTIHSYAAKLGLVGLTGIDLPGELSSLVPSTEWKQKTFGQPWYPGETISVAIGQGAVAVTPLALATMISTVANGGTLVTPHVVRAMDEAGRGWQMVPTPASRSEFRMRPDVLQAVREGLWMVVNAAGTGGKARIEGKDVSGKTGTAQVISLEGARVAKGKIDTRDHGFFVFFAPRDNPQIAGIVFAEHSLHGSSAAPIAKYVMETFFAKQEGRPLPTWPKPVIVATPAQTAARPAAELRSSNFEVRSSTRERRQ
jgi:penicillin-binding protein 2